MKQFHKSENTQIFSECEEVVLTEKSKALLTVNSSQAVISSLLFISFSTDPITLKKEKNLRKSKKKSPTRSWWQLTHSLWFHCPTSMLIFKS
jgi:hypothetical protein